MSYNILLESGDAILAENLGTIVTEDFVPDSGGGGTAGTWLPEGLGPMPMDDEHRSLWKWCSRLYNIIGNIPQGCPFPEGTLPLPGDDEERLYQKINRMLQGPRPPTYYSYDYASDPVVAEDHIEVT